MDDSARPPGIDQVRTLLRDGAVADARTALDRLRDASDDDRKAVLRALRALAEERPDALAPVVPALVAFLTDDARAVRLLTVKLLVSVAAADAEAALDARDALASRLADESEFYYVRARSAEALGYVALDHPDAVASPETVADLRVGLSYDDPEVKRKLAKALAFIALGDPDRLRHQVGRLAASLDAEDDRLRYHLCTALVAVGCEHPDALADAADRLSERLDDECSYVRGRAAEALGLLVTAHDASGEPTTVGGTATSTLRRRLNELTDDDCSFAAARAQWALSRMDGRTGDATDEEIAVIDAIRAHADDVLDELQTADDETCPHCGQPLSPGGPPVCPRCRITPR